MEKFVLICCFFTAGSAFFFPFIQFPNQQRSVMNVCIYSVNPARYQPKCFMCPTSAYSNVLRTCVNAAAVPSNITFTQASCIEQNCAIGRGKRSIDLNNPIEKKAPTEDASILKLNTGQEENKTRAEWEIRGQHHPNGIFKIIGTEEFFASDYEDYDDGSELDK